MYRLRGLGDIYEDSLKVNLTDDEWWLPTPPDVLPSLKQMLQVTPPPQMFNQFVLPGYSPETSYAPISSFPVQWQVYEWLRRNKTMVYLAAAGAGLWLLMGKRRR